MKTIQNTILDDAKEKMLRLPSDWWQRKSSASILLDGFNGHILPLLVAVSVNNVPQYNIYTGILLRYDGTIVWLTAGHVVNELEQLLSLSSTHKLMTMTWLDKLENKEASGIPFHRKDVPMKSWKASGLDIGVVIPSLLDVANISKNEKILPIDSGVWENLYQDKSEGYYAIGFPRSWTTLARKQVSNGKILNTVKADLVCLPLKEISPPEEFAEDSRWSDRDAFYGQIIPFVDDPSFEIENLKGMSGGPILSVERTDDGQIAYRLVGVIQSWAEAQSVLRAEPIDRVSHTIEKWLSEQKTSSGHKTRSRKAR